MTHSAKAVIEINAKDLADCGGKALELEGEIRTTPRPSCFLCGNPGREQYKNTYDWLFGVPGFWTWKHCEACEVMWLDPQTVLEDMPKLYARYYTHSGPTQPPSFDNVRRQTLQYELTRLGYRVEVPKKLFPRFLSRIGPIGRANALEVLDLPASDVGTLLDVGCGNGGFITKMRALGWTVSGVDPDHSAVAYCRAQGIEVFKGSISDVPVDARYDVITLGHVIEHVDDPVHLLQQCRQRLRQPTGRIVITTPNIASLGHRWFKNFWRGLEVPRHLALFSPKSLRACAAHAGLQVKSLSTETRMAVRIHNASACAREGTRNVSEKIRFKPSTKISGYWFMAVENALIVLDRNLGEELFCICTAGKLRTV